MLFLCTKTPPAGVEVAMYSHGGEVWYENETCCRYLASGTRRVAGESKSSELPNMVEEYSRLELF
jgi:hypothetical protein